MKPEDILLDLYNHLSQAIAGWSLMEDDAEFSRTQRDRFAGMADGVCFAQRLISEQIVKLKTERERTW